MTEDPPVWERQPGEPSLWWGRFHAFLLSGHRRSLLASYNKEREGVGEGRKRTAPRSWRDAADRWNWRQRAEAFDAHIRAEQEAVWRERTMPEGEVLAEISDQAHVNVADFFDVGDDGFPALNLAKAQQAGKLHLIRGFKYDRQGRLIVEFHDKQKALELIGRSYKLFTDKHEHSGDLLIRVEYADDYTDTPTPASGTEAGS